MKTHLPLLDDDQPGFTLVELMVVVAIIGILGAFAVRMYVPHVQRTRCQQVMAPTHDTMSRLVEAVAEGNNTFMNAAGAGAAANTQTIVGVTINYPANVTVGYAGNGTAANPFVVTGNRNDIVCNPDTGAAGYVFTEGQYEGVW